MRTTVTLDDDVFQAAQAQAEASGKKLGQVLSQLVRRGLRASTQSATKSGLPVFKVQPDADIIPSSRAKALLAEDARRFTPVPLATNRSTTPGWSK